MPEYVAEKTANILSGKFKKSLNRAKILLLGVTYKKDINDLHESPALEAIKNWKKKEQLFPVRILIYQNL